MAKSQVKIQQTAGRDALGEFAPEFAHLNDDILFGEVWSRNDLLSLRDRSIVTVVSLMSQGLTDSSFKYHLESAKKNGVTRTEMAEILTHAAFYAGWPKAWAAFRMAKEVWDGDAESVAAGSAEAYAQTIFFPVGQPNDAYARYFTGQSYLASIVKEGVPVANVTFEPGCRNNWHIHKALQRRRTNPHLCGRTRLLSGMGQGPGGTPARRCRPHPCRRKTLARGRARQLVLPSCRRSSRRG